MAEGALPGDLPRWAFDVFDVVHGANNVGMPNLAFDVDAAEVASPVPHGVPGRRAVA